MKIFTFWLPDKQPKYINMDGTKWIAEASLGASLRKFYENMEPEDGDFKLVSKEGVEFQIHSLLLCRLFLH